ncbi:uncharacterized protein LOC122363850 [Amphibalanus amphitrite]|uniref:uncharacterized protein LOC122363850 n=1 Tax=Amphibalanus amphitrite TaxID=1232801 RepID=UPI001C90B25C|nr:uncharacterized protein LOC122363850 [Amphibalanus amphitrite]
MIKLTHRNPPQNCLFLDHGRKSVSLDRIPLTLAPFYRYLLLEMQSSVSDPALRPVSRTSISSQPPVASKPAAGASGPSVSCAAAGRAVRSLRRAVERSGARRAERSWAERNFPRVRRAGGGASRLAACAGLLAREEEPRQAADRALGREVAPDQFVLAVKRTTGGLSYTLGSLRGGRGFFVHPPLPSDRRPPLELLTSRQQEVARRRQRHLQQRVAQAQALSRRRRPPAAAADLQTGDAPPPPAVVSDAAARAAPPEFTEVPLWEDPQELPEKRPRKHRKHKDKHSERDLWQRIAGFLGGKAPAPAGRARLGGHEPLQSHSAELHPCPESLSLPSQSRAGRRVSSDDSESSARGAAQRGRSRPPGH